MKFNEVLVKNLKYTVEFIQPVQLKCIFNLCFKDVICLPFEKRIVRFIILDDFDSYLKLGTNTIYTIQCVYDKISILNW